MTHAPLSPTPPLRVLLVEDRPEDATLVRRLLGKTKDVTLAHAPTLTEALACLGDSAFDAALLDLGLPDSRGLDGVRAVLAQAPDVALVVLSGHADRDTAVEAVRSGAQDYLLKDKVDGELLLRALRYAVERKRTADRLRAVTTELRDLYDEAPCGYLTMARDGSIVDVNRTALRWLGYQRGEVVGQLTLKELLTRESFTVFRDLAPGLFTDGFLLDLPAEIQGKAGQALPILLSATALSDAQGRYVKSRFTLTERMPARGGLPFDEAPEEASPAGELPALCASCRRIRDPGGTWFPLEVYLREALGQDFVHTLCDECARNPHSPPQGR